MVQTISIPRSQPLGLGVWSIIKNFPSLVIAPNLVAGRSKLYGRTWGFKMFISLALRLGGVVKV